MPDNHPHHQPSRLSHAALPRADVPGDSKRAGAVRVHAQDGAVCAGVCDGVCGGVFDADGDGEFCLLGS